MDRNNISEARQSAILIVALLAEGVDRNDFTFTEKKKEEVALLAEGVDRNLAEMPPCVAVLGSPSSRRAWIEIFAALQLPRLDPASPSSRRAWIEIP